MLPDAWRRRARLTTLLSIAAVATLAGCASLDADGHPTTADRPPCSYPCQQPTVVTPRKTVVSATPKVRPR